MKDKTNIAELLKDCPQGIELDCTIFEDVYFDNISDCGRFIYCYINHEDHKTNICFSKYGTYSSLDKSKCVIFPKGKTTWEGFHRPFKDGDIIFKNHHVTIVSHIESNGKIWYHCWYNTKYQECKIKNDFGIGHINDGDKIRFATEEEKQKLFQAIKDNGYKWNAETKTLEKLIEPIFEVGNKIEKCGYKFTIAEVKDDYYLTKCGNKIPIDNQDEFSLAHNKFDITTLKPFDKVLVRNTNKDYWKINLFGYISKGDNQYFMCTANSSFYQCIPYEGNEHLLGTTADCDDFYKTWKK